MAILSNWKEQRTMSVAESIRQKLSEAFEPDVLEVIDQSHLHAGHVGARPEGETHFKVDIVSNRFRCMTRIEVNAPCSRYWPRKWRVPFTRSASTRARQRTTENRTKPRRFRFVVGDTKTYKTSYCSTLFSVSGLPAPSENTSRRKGPAGRSKAPDVILGSQPAL